MNRIRYENIKMSLEETFENQWKAEEYIYKYIMFKYKEYLYKRLYGSAMSGYKEYENGEEYEYFKNELDMIMEKIKIEYENLYSVDVPRKYSDCLQDHKEMLKNL